jgi:glycosyltransferase involved in cell wall biosynthesis
LSSSTKDHGFDLAVYSESPFMGGGEQMLVTLLSRLDDRIDVTLVGPFASILERIAAVRTGTRVRTVRPVRNRRDVAGIASQLRAIRDLRPAILQTNGNPWTCHYALLAGRITPGVKTLAVHHAVPEPGTPGQLRRTRLNLRHLDAQVGVSKRGARLVEQIAGLEEGAVRVIHNGVADPPITPVERPVDGPIVGTVGRLSWEKGHDVLLQALEGLPGVTGVVVGEGPDMERLRTMARELGLGDRALLLGWQPSSRAWLQTFDVFVMPSLEEDLPLAIVEAMLASRPVVATRVGGVSEAVLEGRTGLLVPPGDHAALADALRSLIDDPARREQMGSAAREHATRTFDLDRMVRSYESLYRDLLDS